ncbi:YadA-like family protein [Veillonella intestinalis]|uniref:YadA-like family protein n=2 Tax=Veillonella intestinalis TaxID=2941341 RepID=UPI00203D710F|nr:YadA-like family protein [Veillonella intestinalis]
MVAKFGSQITELQGWTRDLYIKSNAMPAPGTGKGVALGKDSVAKSESAVAIGNGANASEEEYANVAIGSAAQALGGSTVAIGSGAQSMTGGAVAIGTNVTLTDENSHGSTNSIGIGHSIHSNGVSSILIGEDIGTTDTPNKNGYMVGIGYKVNPSYDSVAIGSFSSTQGSGVAIGAGSHALADNGVAIGFTSFAASQNSVALGHNSYAYTGNVAAKSYLSNEDFSADNGVVAIGNNFELTLGNDKFPINHRRITGVAGGADEYDAVNVKQLQALSTDVDTRIANKMSNISGSSVEYVSINPDRDADKIINKDNHGAEKPGAIAIGSGAKTNGYESIALGNRATVAYDGKDDSAGQIAIGFNSKANNTASLAIGVEANADNGIAIGNLAYSKETTSVSIGENSKANNQGSIAIGNWTVSEFRGVAIGQDAVAHSEQSTALGSKTGAYAHNSVATGSNASTYSAGSIAIGSNAIVYSRDPINEAKFQSKTDDVKANFKPSPKNNNSEPENNLYYLISQTSGNGVAIGSNATVQKDQGLAIGMNATSEVLDGVAIGSNSKATINSQVVGYDPNPNSKKDLGSPVWKSKLGAVSVGYGEYKDESGRKKEANTRQITNVAAGSKNTDAVNVAQLKSLNQKVDTNKISYVSIKSKETGNKDNLGATGTDSVAIGPNAQSIGKNSVALGSNVKASIADAIIIGRDITDGKGIIVGVSSVATTDHSIAIGVEADASGNARNTAVGWKSKATGDYSVAYGQNSQALGESSVALGTSVTANGKAGIAIGNSSVSNSENKTESSIAIGDRAKAENDAGVAIGLRTTASGDRSTALGFFANSSGKNATALGADTEAIGSSSVALGSGAKAEVERSIAIGSSSVADRAAGTFGYSPEAGTFANEGELMAYLGKVDEYNALTTQALEKQKEMLEKKAAADANPGDSTLLKAALQARKELLAIVDERNKLSVAYKSGLGAVSVGNEYATRQITHVAAGTEDTDAVNVAQLKALNNKVDANKISYVSINSTETGNKDNTGATGTDSLAIGPNASASANNTVALGSNVTAGINNAIVIGSNITDGKGVVIGVNSAATSEHSVAIGTHATAGDTNQSDVAIGNYAKARGYSVAIGDGANAFDINDPTSDASGLSVAIGSSAAATGQGGVAVGQGAKAAFQSNAMGSGAKATGRGTVSIGDTSEASAAAAVALGNRAKATDTFSMALGMEAEATKSGSVAVGAQTKANGGWSLAVGRSTVASGEMATALGYKTTADGARSIAIGPWANTSEGSYGTAIGYNAKTKGTNTIALGGYTEAFSDKAMALGYASEGNVENGVALGAYSVADREEGKLGYTVDDVTFNKAEDIALYLGKSAEYEAATKDFNEKVAAYNAKFAELEKDPNNEQLKSEVATLEKAAYASQNARNAIVSPYLSGLGAISVGTASDTRQITNVAAGTEDTDAVNVAQLKALNNKVDANAIEYVSIKSTEAGNKDNSGATGNNAIAIGPDAQAIAKGGVAIGNSSKAKANDTVALGSRADAQNTSDIALGTEAIASGGWSVAIGQNSAFSGEISLAVGFDAQASGMHSQALGIISRASGDAANAFGSQASASGLAANAIGLQANAAGDDSIAIGRNATAQLQGVNGIAIGISSYIGKKTETGGTPEQGIPDNSLVIAEDDTTSGKPNQEYKNSIAIGNTAKSFGYQNTVLGAGAEAHDTNEVAVGTAAKARGHYAVALGQQANANGKNATALGHWARAYGESTVAIGDFAITNTLDGKDSVTNAIAIGSLARTASNNSIALGSNSLAYIADDVKTKSYLSDETFGKEDGVVSVGNAEYTIGDTTVEANRRRITNVAGGADDYDAVNVKQLKALNLSIIGDNKAEDVPVEGKVNLATQKLAINGDGNITTTVAEDGQSINLTLSKSVTDKLGAVKYLSVNSTETGTGSNEDNTGAQSIHAIAIGPKAAVGPGEPEPGKEYGPSSQYGVALGYNSHVIGSTSGTALGPETVVNNSNSAVAVGRNATVENSNMGVSLGNGSHTTNSQYGMALGNRSNITDAANSVALGYSATVNKVTRGTALGSQASVTATGGVALGADSIASTNGAVLGYNPLTGAQFTSLDEVAKVAGVSEQYAPLKEQRDNLAATVATQQAEYDRLTALYEQDKTNAEVKKARRELGDALDASELQLNNVEAAIDHLVSAYVSNDGAVSVGRDAYQHKGKIYSDINRQITHVAAGTEDTDAVNVAQLKQVQKLANNHTAIMVNDVAPVAGADGAYGKYVDANGLSVAVKDVEGQKIYDFKLSKDITVGTPGKDGKDGTPGSITIVGEKGKDGADGTPGKNAIAEITVKEGTPGIDGKDGESITRIVYETGEKDDNGNPIVTEVATLNDGMKFAGDDFVDDSTKYVAKKLNEQLDIKGGAAADALSDNNIGVVADVDSKTSEITGLRVKLAKNIKLNDGSVEFAEVIVDTKGNPLVKGQDDKWYTKDGVLVENPIIGKVKLSVTGLDNGNQRITNVATGTADTDAVNVAQLKQVESLANKHTAIKVNDVAPVAGADGAYGKYVDANGLSVAVKDVEGQKIYDFKLSKDITVGTPGKDGKDGTPGSITIVGEKGKDGADGTPGKNAIAEITVKEGTPGVDGKDGESITRIVYETGKDANDNPIVTEVATLNDGMKFAGDDFVDDSTKYVAKKLNEQLDIKGGAAANALSDNNIGVVADVDSKDPSKVTGLRVKLAKNIILPDGSVRIVGPTDKEGKPTGSIYIANQKPTPKVADEDAPDKAVEGLYITGLDNTDWNPDTTGIVENRAATEKQLQTAISNISSQVGEAGVWKLQVNGAGERSIKKNSIINFKDGKKIKVTQSGNDITIGVDPAFVKEVTDNTSNITTLNNRVSKVEGDIKNITNNGIVTKVEGDATGVKVTPVDASEPSKGVKVSLDEKITVGGIVIDGTKPKDGEPANNTIKGLTNTTWDGATFESGRAATEDQLQAVDGKITNIIDNITDIAGVTTIKEGDGNILAPKTDGKNEYTLSLNKDLKVGNSIAVGDKVYITKDGINANGKPISNIEAVELSADGNYAATTGQVFEVRETLEKQIGSVANVVQNNTRQISRLDTKINKSGAGLAALAALHPLDYDPDNKWNFTAGIGTYHGSNSVALGAFYRPNENTMFSVGGTLGNGEDMMNFGVSMKFGESNPYAGMSKGRLIEYVEKQTTEIDDLKAQNESQNERIKKLEELVQSLMISK